MVKPTKPVIVWNIRASISFKDAYTRIREKSQTNAEKFRNGINKIVDSLPSHPEKYHQISLRETIKEIIEPSKNILIVLHISTL